MRALKKLLSPQQMYAIQIMHEEFARRCSCALADLLPGTPKLAVARLEQLQLTEHLFSCSHPTCLQVLQPAGLNGQWLLDISPQLAYPVINSLLGGNPKDEIQPQREITEIEWQVLKPLHQSLLAELYTSWSDFQVSSIDCKDALVNPQLAQIAPATAGLVVVHFELAFLGGEVCELLSLAYPFDSITPVCTAILNTHLNSPDQNAEAPTQVKLAETPVRVNLARSTISSADLMHLQVGDIVTTEQAVGEELEVEIDGVGLMRGRVGALRGKKAVEITQTLDDVANN
ncbi:MAG: FliM/FliN family flagellar motor switch protein [Planctomycetota bacterium]